MFVSCSHKFLLQQGGSASRTDLGMWMGEEVGIFKGNKDWSWKKHPTDRTGRLDMLL